MTVRPAPAAAATSTRQQVLDEAAELFGRHGYEATSMRAIAASLGISAAALYNHFTSKEDIYCTAHEQGMSQVMQAVQRATTGIEDPWQRLEAAACAHCAVLLSSHAYRTIITPNFPKSLKKRRQELVAQRDAYEAWVKNLIASLGLAPEVDQTLLRMHLLGALNWATNWYRPGRRITPEDIGRQIVKTLRYGVESVASATREAG